MKITGQIEQIFAHAVALDQNGNLKNSIYVTGKEIYIMNFDYTVMMRFKLRDTESPFSSPISFKANDYDSNEFQEEDGKIVFITSIAGYERKKICGTAEVTPEEAKLIFKPFIKDRKEKETLVLNKSLLSLLHEGLSHIEFSGKAGESLNMIQRNIYSGGVINISEKSDGLFSNTLKNDFGPIGIRTKDFIALFSFQDTLKFIFPNETKEDFMLVKSVDKKKRDMTAVVSCCLYDELIELQKSRK
jgi:hypothetical protein